VFFESDAGYVFNGLIEVGILAPFLEPFCNAMCKNDQFTKTGLGQTLKHRKSETFSAG
jgi:hypothetical protein